MPERETDLQIAVRHVADGRRIVARQRERIAKLRAAGHSVLDHEKTLQVFESSLQILEDHERMLRERALGKASNAALSV